MNIRRTALCLPIAGLVLLLLLTGAGSLSAQSDSSKVRKPPRSKTLVPADAKPESLGSNINSGAHEYCPVISPDGATLYFVRKGLSPNSTEKIWYSTKGADGTWSLAQNIGAPLNDINNDGVLTVTPDGNTLLLHGTYGFGTGFSVSHKTLNGWSRPVRLPIRNYYIRSLYDNAYLLNDGKTLIMSVERDDSFGPDNDLYVSFLQGDGMWSEPMNLGPTINTPTTETAPFMAADGVTLYFASAGHGGFGGSDIFMSRRLDSTWTKWSEPLNLGPTINSKDHEQFFFITASGDYAYYSSIVEASQQYDIFRILLPEFARPHPVVLVKGRVLDKKTGKPVGARIIYETLSDGREAGIARSDPKDGHYEIALPAGASYGFRAEAEGYIPINDNIDLRKLKSYREINRDLYLVPIEAGQVVRVNNVFFDSGEWTLRSESFPELDRIVGMLRGNASMRITVQGHTDNVGTVTENRKLSENRARAVIDYLASHGADSTRIAMKGFGATRPVAPNNSDEGRQQNRRVEFVILKR